MSKAGKDLWRLKNYVLSVFTVILNLIWGQEIFRFCDIEGDAEIHIGKDFLNALNIACEWETISSASARLVCNIIQWLYGNP